MAGVEEIGKVLTLTAGNLIEGAASLITLHAIVKAIWLYIRRAYQSNEIDQTAVRLSLGKTLALVLEFLLAADVLRTAVAPTWEEIGKLTAIATLRTLLNYFLERELKHGHSMKM